MSLLDSPTSDIDSAMFNELSPISLDELNAAAALQERVDRKYILTRQQLDELLTQQSSRLAVLEIDARRSFRYESTYFDTPGLRSYHDAARRRRQRFKVRTRTYVDTRTTMLEIKTRTGRGVTVKQRLAHVFDERTRIPTDAFTVIDAALGQKGLAHTLEPTLTTAYLRSTLVDLDDVARVTVDASLRCTDPRGRSVALNDRFVLETKSIGHPCLTDRHLWSVGIRPAKISKFGTGLAALNPELPSNKWHQTLHRHFASHA